MSRLFLINRGSISVIAEVLADSIDGNFTDEVAAW